VAFGGLDERHKRISVVFAMTFYFPKLDVAGSNPVSRSRINNLQAYAIHNLR
jgi:hypothetical protein